jgi:hypothetical protein
MSQTKQSNIDEILKQFEVALFEIVGDKFAPKQANGSPERKELLGLIGPAYPLVNEAKTALLALIEQVGLSVIGEDLVCDKSKDSHGFCFRCGEIAATNKEKVEQLQRLSAWLEEQRNG